MEFSLYKNIKARENEVISVDNYIDIIRSGANYQDLIFQARSVKAKMLKAETVEEKEKLKAEYDELKRGQANITGSGLIKSGESRSDKNIYKRNGLLIIDIDDNQVTEELRMKLQADEYTFIMHTSFGGGNNYCIFVKINPERFEDSFDSLADYYYKTYNIAIDPSCKNLSRIRYLSYDPAIHHNPSAKIFRKYIKKEKAVKHEELEYVYFQDDFAHIMDQIQANSIDLVQGDYQRYIRIGFALYNQFGAVDGWEYFRVINIYNPNLNKKRAEAEWKALCKYGDTKIGTFYHYCKEAGIDTYTQKTRDIISSIVTSKATGKPTVKSIEDHVKVSFGHDLSDADKTAVESLINMDNAKFRSVTAISNKDLTKIEILVNFVRGFEPSADVINKNINFGDKAYDDYILNDIWISAETNLGEKINKEHIKNILFSSSITQFNPLMDLISTNLEDGVEYRGYIDQYIDCVVNESNTPEMREFQRYFFKKWFVGMVYNWFGGKNFNRNVSELIFCLISPQMGTGKTSFFKMLLPDELFRYFSSETLNVKDKDTMLRMATSLIILDDEFGGKSFKNDEELKSLTSKDYLVIRRPFRTADETFRRICGLCATSNKKELLKDPNGNRRIIPINIKRVNLIELDKVDRIKMILEAYQLMNEGFDYKVFTEEDIEYLRANTEQNSTVVPVAETFDDWFKVSAEGDNDTEVIVNQGQIKNFLTGIVGNFSNDDFKDVLMRSNMDYRIHTLDGKRKRGYRVFVPSNINNYCKMGVKILADKIEEEMPF